MIFILKFNYRSLIILGHRDLYILIDKEMYSFPPCTILTPKIPIQVCNKCKEWEIKFITIISFMLNMKSDWFKDSW